MKYQNLSQISILFIEDNPPQEINLLKKHTNLYLTPSSKAIENFEKLTPDLVITDIFFQNIEAKKIIQHIKKKDRTIPIIILTTSDKIQLVLKAIKFGIDGFFLKPLKNIKNYLEILDQKATLILAKKEKIRKEKILRAIANCFDIAFFVENEKIIFLKEYNIEKNIQDFLNNLTPKLKLQKSKEIVKYKNHFYHIKITPYSKNDFLITMKKLM